MTILEKYAKQPSEVQDYDVDFAPWLTGLADTISSFVVAAEAVGDVGTQPDVDAVAHIGNRIKVWLSGGTDGAACKVTVRVTTVGGRVKEDEIIVKVKET